MKDFNSKFLEIAINEAKKAVDEDEVPIGCVIVFNNKIIAKAHNNKVKKNDATCHAEIECIKKASKKLQTWHLDNCEMYVTLEPCLMCTGAIVNSRISKVYFAAKDPKGGALVSNVQLNEVKNLNHYPQMIYINNVSCETLLKDFFKSKRKLPRK